MTAQVKNTVCLFSLGRFLVQVIALDYSGHMQGEKSSCIINLLEEQERSLWLRRPL